MTRSSRVPELRGKARSHLKSWPRGVRAKTTTARSSLRSMSLGINSAPHTATATGLAAGTPRVDAMELKIVKASTGGYSPRSSGHAASREGSSSVLIEAYVKGESTRKDDESPNLPCS